MLVALMGQSLIALVFLTVVLSGWLPATYIFLFACLCFIGFTNSISRASDRAALLMGLGTLISVLMNLLDSLYAVPMVLAMADWSLLALVVLVVGRRRIPAGVAVDPDPATVLLH